MICYYGICPTALTDPRPIITPLKHPVRVVRRERSDRRTRAQVEAWVLDTLRTFGKPTPLIPLAERMGAARSYVYTLIGQLCSAGKVRRVGERRHYRYAEVV
jgi:hypothetical protein